MKTDVETEKLHVHYDHQDDCREFRWTAKESYEYLYDKPWEDVIDFYSHLAAGRLSLSDLVFHGSKKGNIARPDGNAAAPSCTGTHLENNSKKNLKEESGQGRHSKYFYLMMEIYLTGGKNSQD